MISDSQLPELKTFRRAERALPLSQDPKYAALVVASSNEDYPVHRWFRFKEAFSADLLSAIVAAVPPTDGTLRVLDPFCGVGTCLLAAQELSGNGRDIVAVGIERNPFIAFCAGVKVRWPLIAPHAIAQLGEEILRTFSGRKPKLPSLSSLDDTCMSARTALRVVAIRDAIREHGQDATHDALLIGLAASIEPVSRARKDGRMLRLVARKPAPLPTTVRSRWKIIASDAAFMQRALGPVAIPNVILGDGRAPLSAGIAPGSIDLILTSPPYPNAIDYSEVYKLELWLLGFVTDNQAFRELRYSTLRSHPTIRDAEMPDDLTRCLRRGRVATLLRPILEKTARSPKKWRRRMLLGYVCDLWNALGEYETCVRKGGHCVLVVGNSLHGGPEYPYLIPTDLLLLELARERGFEPVQGLIARALRRRLAGNHFLRESVIILRKP